MVADSEPTKALRELHRLNARRFYEKSNSSIPLLAKGQITKASTNFVLKETGLHLFFKQNFKLCTRAINYLLHIKNLPFFKKKMV